MKIKLGLFGADDTLEIIRPIVEEYEEFECLPIVFWHEDEVIEKIRPHIQEVDMWLFSGQVPYAIAKEQAGITKPMFYVPHTGSSLYKTLLHIAYQQQIPVDELSFDTYHESELNRILQEAELTAKPKFLKHYPGVMRGDLLAQYHYELWRAGKTKAAVTCLRSANLALEKLGVPVYRILPTRSAIESTLHLILRTKKMLSFMDTQIAVQMIVVDSFFGMARDSFSTDEVYKMEIAIMEKLLHYAKRVQGSVKPAGPGRYVIFTTRGLLQEITQEFSAIPDLEELYKISKDQVTCGIGIGRTAYDAEINAGKALLHARDYGRGSWFVIDEDKTIIGPLGRAEKLNYSGNDQALQELSQQTSLSISTLSKLNSILQKIGKTELSAHELAQHLKILPRSARRILMELEAHQLAEVIGEETLSPRGRPRKIYKIYLRQALL